MSIVHMLRIAAVAMATTALLTSTQVASATEMGHNSIESELLLIDIDEEQARSAGNRVEINGAFKVLIDGRTGAQIAQVPVSGVGRPHGTVYGNCGSSHFDIFDGPGDDYFFVTGFDLYPPRQAIDFSWAVSVTGEWDREEGGSGTDSLEWDDGYPLPAVQTWSSGAIHDSQFSPSGTYYYGRVTSGLAVLSSGEVCYSGNPSDGRALSR